MWHSFDDLQPHWLGGRYPDRGSGWASANHVGSRQLRGRFRTALSGLKGGVAAVKRGRAWLLSSQAEYSRVSYDLTARLLIMVSDLRPIPSAACLG